MIDEGTQEQASLYALDLLNSEEKAIFEARLRSSSELRALVDDFREAAAVLVLAIPPRELPPRFEEKVFEAIENSEKIISFPKSKPMAWVPWAIAAALAFACTILYSSLSDTRKELAEAQQKPEMKVAVLGSKIDKAPQANAVVVWDPKNQEGLVRLDGVPDLLPGKDYQLWVIDPSYKAPVSAGVITAEAKHGAVTFHATQPIKDAQKFAISIEKAGGVAEVGGPIAFISN